ncbi:MAG: DivIVA domain-containing protein [Clostridia bacterium]|nr:DivIVA domain-containing protein [Clostridia bacterium]
MSVSKTFSDAKFSRGVAGYNIKEVDAFLHTAAAETAELESKLATLQAKLAAYDAEKEKIAQEKAAADELLRLAEAKAKKLLSEAQSAARACERAAEIEAENLRTSAESKAQNRLHAAQVQADGVIADAEAAAKEKIEEAEETAARILAAADGRGRQMIAAAEKKTAEETDRYAAIVAAGREYTASVAELTENLRKNLAALNDRTKPHLDAAIAARPHPAETAAAPGSKEAPLDVPMPEGRTAAERPEGQRRARRGVSPTDGETETAGTESAGEETAVRDFSFAGGRLLDGDQPKSEPGVKPYGTVNVTYDDTDNGFADVEKIIAAGKQGRKNPTGFAGK